MKKIMFNDKYGLTDAVLQGCKTMTRRMCLDYDTGAIMTQDYKSVLYQPSYNIIQCYTGRGPIHYSKDAAYKIGEVVAVAQAYKDTGLFDVYRGPENTPGWSNKMFVRADLMPHQIQITDIKVERLQDISEEDCLKEGIQEYFPYIDRDPNDKVRTFRYFKDGKIRHCISPASKCFAHLIDDISGKGTWESNPYVFAYTFKLVK